MAGRLCSPRKIALFVIATCLGIFSVGRFGRTPTVRSRDVEITSTEVATTPVPRTTIEPRPHVYMSKPLDLYLHTGFHDDRRGLGSIRIFGLHNKTKLPKIFWCRFKTENGSVDVKAKNYDVDRSWPQWSIYYAVEIDCKVQEGFLLDNLYLFSNTTYKVSYKIPIEKNIEAKPRRSLAVCVKPMTGPMNFVKLIEWFEMFQAVGVKDFIAYNTDLHGPARYVLEHYQKYGLLDQVSFPFLYSTLAQLEDRQHLTSEERYAIYQQIYLVAMHDCFYRYRKKYTHMLFIDVDEVITPPMTNLTLQDVVAKATKIYTTAASFLFLTAWHFENHGEIKGNNPPDYLYMQKYLSATEPIDNQPKGITVVDRTITLNFHTAVDVYEKGLSNEMLPWKEYGYLHHYRGKCEDKFPEERCKNELLPNKRTDPIIPQYREKVGRKVKQVLDLLKMTPDK